MNALNFDSKHSLIIGEVAQAHDGSLGMAHAYIDAVAAAGADVVKFQTHIASAESTLEEPWRVKFSLQDNTRYEYWKRMEFTAEQWAGLRQHALDKGLEFLSSPFSIEAVELLLRIGVSAWKIASGEVSNTPLLERIISTRLPIFLSSGMSRFEELDKAVTLIKAQNIPLTVLQCTTAYPCPPEKVGLNMIPVYRERYQCAVGLSDHSGTIYAGLAAATIGIEALEVHITFSREMFGPDVPASLTTAELRQLVEGVRFIERMKAYPVDKDAVAQDMDSLRNTFGQSVVVVTDLPEGTVLRREHLATKKPGLGIKAEHLYETVGRRLRRDVKANQFLTEDLLE